MDTADTTEMKMLAPGWTRSVDMLCITHDRTGVRLPDELTQEWGPAVTIHVMDAIDSMLDAGE